MVTSLDSLKQRSLPVTWLPGATCDIRGSMEHNLGLAQNGIKLENAFCRSNVLLKEKYPGQSWTNTFFQCFREMPELQFSSNSRAFELIGHPCQRPQNRPNASRCGERAWLWARCIAQLAHRITHWHTHILSSHVALESRLWATAIDCVTFSYWSAEKRTRNYVSWDHRGYRKELLVSSCQILFGSLSLSIDIR